MSWSVMGLFTMWHTPLLPSALHHLLKDDTSSGIEHAATFAELLQKDDILGTLHHMLCVMHNVPYLSNHTMHGDEGYPHSILHTLLWMCHPRGVRYDSETHNQTSWQDIGIVTARYRHYLELKKDNSTESATDACEQIKVNGYDKIYPREAPDQAKPAFYYGIKWSNKSTHATVYVDADENAKKTNLWTTQFEKEAGREKIIKP
jgi:hypothetical protein